MDSTNSIYFLGGSRISSPMLSVSPLDGSFKCTHRILQASRMVSPELRRNFRSTSAPGKYFLCVFEGEVTICIPSVEIFSMKTPCFESPEMRSAFRSTRIRFERLRSMAILYFFLHESARIFFHKKHALTNRFLFQYYFFASCLPTFLLSMVTI